MIGDVRCIYEKRDVRITANRQEEAVNAARRKSSFAMITTTKTEQEKVMEKQKVYVIRLGGGRDSEWKVIDKLTWDFLNSLEKHKVPTVPEELIDRYIEQWDEEVETREQIAAHFKPDPQSGSWENDIWLAIPQTPFGGELFLGDTVKELNAFCKKHNLEIEDEIEGYIY